MSDRTELEQRSRFDLLVPTRPAVLVAVFLILVWLLFMFYETTNMLPPTLPGYPGDAFFPRIVLIFGLVCASFIVIRGLLLRRDAPLASGEAAEFSIHWPEFVSVCVLVIAYGQLLEPVGFEITTFIILIVLLTPRIHATVPSFGRSFAYAFVLSLLTTFIFYVAFGLLLRIPLPLKFLPTHIQF